MENQSTEEDLHYVNNALTISNSLEEQKEIHNKINTIVNTIKQFKRYTKQAEKSLNLLKDKYHEEFPDICPFCGK